MLTREEYIQASLENNLFWLRIMKEHAFFIQSAIPPIHKQLIQRADMFRQQFDKLLAVTIPLANGSISREALESGEFYTRYTYEAEKIARKFTGVPINLELTVAETNIEPFNPLGNNSAKKEMKVSELNKTIMKLLDAFLKFKAELLDSQATCRIFTFIYTAVLDHVLREGKQYWDVLSSLQRREMPEVNEEPELEMFWNRIMAEHAKTMRGLLDPSEAMLFNEANDFAMLFEQLMENARNTMDQENDLEYGSWLNSLVDNELYKMEDEDDRIEPDDEDDKIPGHEEDNEEPGHEDDDHEDDHEDDDSYENDSLKATRELADFKTDVTEGIIACKVKSLMLPLFTDHLLREANHYIRLLLHANH